MIVCSLEIGTGIIAHERSRKRHLLCVSGVAPPQQGIKVHLLHMWLRIGLWVIRVDYDGSRD